MTETINIIIPGKPVPKERPRYSSKSQTIYTPAKTLAWEKEVGYLANKAMAGRKPFIRPLTIVIIAYMSPPESWPQWKKELALQGDLAPTGTPDTDNITKSVKDALEGIVYENDSLIIWDNSSKQYGLTDKITVQIRPLYLVPSSVKTKEEYLNFGKVLET